MIEEEERKICHLIRHIKYCVIDFPLSSSLESIYLAYGTVIDDDNRYLSWHFHPFRYQSTDLRTHPLSAFRLFCLAKL